MIEKASPRTGVFLGLASFVVVLAGMRFAAAIVEPLLLSVFIAILLAPAQSWLMMRGIRHAWALTLVITAMLGLVFLVVAALGNSTQDFVRNLPEYSERLGQMSQRLTMWISGFGVEISRDSITQYLDLGAAIGVVGRLISGTQGALANGFFILITVILILAELPSIPNKWRLASPEAASSLRRFDAVAKKINRYMALKAGISLFTGLTVTLCLLVIGVDFPVLWGLLAFFLNFIPTIGSILAAIPAVLLAIVQLGIGAGAATASVYMVINVVIGNFIEPRYMGQQLGLSTLVVFLSLVFWGWLLGSVGMVLSVPLTIAGKIALEAHPDTKWIAILLSDRVGGKSSSAVAEQTSEEKSVDS